jgi:VIT1/CCC1 family predicted Fe2+/Mn2+ transporter
VPLLPYFFERAAESSFTISIVATAATMFAIGSARTFVTRRSPWRNGLEMLLVGALAGTAAFLAGLLVDSIQIAT